MRDWIGTETENAGKAVVLSADVSGKIASLQAVVQSLSRGNTQTLNLSPHPRFRHRR